MFNRNVLIPLFEISIISVLIKIVYNMIILGVFNYKVI